MGKYKVLITDKLSDEALAVFKKHPEFEVTVKLGLTEDQLVAEVPAYDAHLIRSGTKVTKKVIDAATKMKVIGRAGVGVDNVDKDAAKAKGIAVMNTPLGNVNSAAEISAAMMICLARKLHLAHSSMAKGEWDRKSFVGRELKGKTLGIIGVGNVGQILAKIANGFSMKVIGTSRSKTPDALKLWGVEKVEMEDLLKRSDFISINLTLAPDTKYTLDAPQFAMMKKGVYLINAGRGGLINEKALAEAIKGGKVAGAAIDVWESEPPPKDNLLLNMPEVLMAPHVGASTIEAQENVAVDVANQIVNAFKNGKIENCVNGVAKLRA
jgi:D-3-phosphoglycerate dehydrogenase / 2-oxoglutarate reductase